jgi:hypothetical protein
LACHLLFYPFQFPSLSEELSQSYLKENRSVIILHQSLKLFVMRPELGVGTQRWACGVQRPLGQREDDQGKDHAKRVDASSPMKQFRRLMPESLLHRTLKLI